MHEEEDVAAGLARGTVQAQTPAPRPAHDPRPDPLERPRRLGAVPAIREQDFGFSGDGETAEALGDLRSFASNRDNQRDQKGVDASIVVAVKIAMPAAVLAGGASRRMGVPKAALPYGRTTLLVHQAERLAEIFEGVFVVAKEASGFDAAPARLLLDRGSVRAPIHGLVRALEEVSDRVFILAVDLPVVNADVLRAIAERGLASAAPAVVPRADGRLQPLAAVWRVSVLPAARERVARGELSLHGLAEEVGAEIFPEEAWRAIDPSGNSFANLNTIEEYAAIRERA